MVTVKLLYLPTEPMYDKYVKIVILGAKVGQQFQDKCRLLNYFKHNGDIISISDYLQTLPENLVRWHGKNSNSCLILEFICRKPERSTDINMQIGMSRRRKFKFARNDTRKFFTCLESLEVGFWEIKLKILALMP